MQLNVAFHLTHLAAQTAFVHVSRQTHRHPGRYVPHLDNVPCPCPCYRF